jgi:hypothetical protein
MHPVLIQQLAADHIKEMQAMAAHEPLARQTRGGPVAARLRPDHGLRPAMIPAWTQRPRQPARPRRPGLPQRHHSPHPARPRP